MLSSLIVLFNIRQSYVSYILIYRWSFYYSDIQQGIDNFARHHLVSTLFCYLDDECMYGTFSDHTHVYTPT